MKHIVPVKYNEETDDYFIELPPDVWEQTGWEVGDTVVWKESGNGSFILSKKMDHETSDQKNDGPDHGAAKE